MRETHLRQGRQTLKLGLVKVIHDMFPEETLETSYSILEGFFCKLSKTALSVREVRQIALYLKKWIEINEQIKFLFIKDGFYHYKVDDMVIAAIYPAYTNPAMVEYFQITPFSDGFTVDFQDIFNGEVKMVPPYLLSQYFNIYLQRLDNLNLKYVDDVNSYVKAGREEYLISLSEALHDKEIIEIAETITQQRRALKVLLIAGPSASGKKTFTQRLSTHLRLNGIVPVNLFLNDYFVDKDEMPRNDDGDYDFESIKSLDYEYLNSQLIRLVEGEEVEAPKFDLKAGHRSDMKTRIKLNESGILLIEGIHALNPELVKNINRNHIYKVYTNTFGGINIDPMNMIPSTEARLIRRLVRDNLDRGTPPEVTIERWTEIRKKENYYVVNYQEEADMIFNSGLLYELNILRPYAEKVLEKITEMSPYYDTKTRLLNLMTFFDSFESNKIPHDSVLREYIGGNIYTKW